MRAASEGKGVRPRPAAEGAKPLMNPPHRKKKKERTTISDCFRKGEKEMR